MTSRDLVIRTLNHQPTPRAPRDLWLSPQVEAARSEDLAEIQVRYPSDVNWVECKPAAGKRGAARPPQDGVFVDAWDCKWTVGKPGMMDEICESPLADLARLAAFRPPTEILDAARFAPANQAGELGSRFVVGQSDVRPFERLQALRGAKAAVVDLARDTKEIRGLLATVHELNCRELELWGATAVDGVALRDAWGSVDALHVAPAMWREVFKPLYREYCRILHAKDKFVLLISAGNIADILADLVKIEVDAVHSQWATMNLDRVAKRFRGRITFWGGLDQPETLGRGSVEEVRRAVERVRQALDFGAGGVIAQARWDLDTPLPHLAGFFEQWLQPMPMHAS